jgi:integral membrane protein (TIGR01906 family)
MEAIVKPTITNGNRFLSRVLRAYLTLALPILLVLASIRVVMTPMFLSFEYTRADFPEDIYGFTREDRLNYAPIAVNYLLNGEDITYLSDLRFPDGASLYNARELHHMRDVKAVTQLAFLVAVVMGASSIVAAYVMRRLSSRSMWQGLISGSVVTLAIIAAIVIAAVANWDFFFTGFHTLFFASGSWRFAYSDTLIRLFPEQFWFDAALVIGGMTTLGAAIILVISWRRM